jgi:hypothetical protein
MENASTKTLKVPTLKDGAFTVKEVPFDEAVKSFQEVMAEIPNTIKRMKAADNEGWQEFFNLISEQIEKDPNWKNFIREKTVDGKLHFSVSEPNWLLTVVALAAAGGGAFAITCALYTPCKKMWS